MTRVSVYRAGRQHGPRPLADDLMRRRSHHENIHCAATRDTHDDKIYGACASEPDDGVGRFTLDHDRHGCAVVT